MLFSRYSMPLRLIVQGRKDVTPVDQQGPQTYLPPLGSDDRELE